MKKSRKILRNSAEAGVALLELAIIVPFIGLVILATIETGRLFRAAQLGTTLAREASHAAFRKCADFYEPAGEDSEATIGRTNACLASLFQRPDGTPEPLLDAINAAAPGGGIVVEISVFRWVQAPTTANNNLQRFGVVTSADPLNASPVLKTNLTIPDAKNAQIHGKNGAIVSFANTALDAAVDAGGNAVVDGGGNIVGATVPLSQRVVVAEVFYRMSPFFEMIPILNDNLVQDGFYYIASIV